MLHLDRLARELDSRREAFRSYGQTRREDAARYGGRLLELTRQTSDEIIQKTAAERAPGSLPSDELDLHHNISADVAARRERRVVERH